MDEEIGGCIDWTAIKAKKNLARSRIAAPAPKAFPKRLQPHRASKGVIPKLQGRNNFSSSAGSCLENGDLGPVDPDSPHGAMNTEAASVIMKIMHAARNCRLGRLGRWQGD